MSCYGQSSVSYADTCPNLVVGRPAFLFRGLLNTLLVSQCALNSVKYPPNYSMCKEEDFDFVIIGGGTAGSVLLNRLTEISNWKVLMIEAGGDPKITSNVPFLQSYQVDSDWEFLTEKSEFHKGMVNYKTRWLAGKVLGGSSVIGRMLYTRGTREDFKKWSENKGWNFEEILRYFKRAENLRDTDCALSNFYGVGGYLNIDKFNTTFPAVQALINAAKLFGFDILKHPGVEKTGYLKSHANIFNGERMSVSKAYLSPIRKRKNVYVLKNAYVRKILIDPKTKSARGVEVRMENKVKIFRASKEVIVSAGAINTPKILMLSGIGPKTDLKKLGIPVIADLKVGYNLQDHPAFIGIPFIFNWTKPDQRMDDLDAAYSYLTRRSGRYGTIGVSEVLGYLSSTNGNVPDVLLFHSMLSRNNSNELTTFGRSFNLKREVLYAYKKLIQSYDILLVTPVILSPKSRGRIMLRSKNPEEPPIINPNYFCDQADKDTIMRTLHLIKDMADSFAFKKYFTEIKRLNLGECSDHSFATDNYWACLLGQLTVSFFDYAGTAKMGPRGRSDSVVGNDLKVHDVNNLRVVDASIMPFLTSGPLLATTVMIAEKASDMITADYLVIKANTTQQNLLCKKENCAKPAAEKTRRTQKSKFG